MYGTAEVLARENDLRLQFLGHDEKNAWYSVRFIVFVLRLAKASTHSMTRNFFSIDAPSGELYFCVLEIVRFLPSFASLEVFCL